MKDLHGIIFAYISNTRLKELTEHRTASSVPFGGRYRIIDFMLSNMVNAGVTDVGVIMRENYQSLLDHLGSGKDWDLSRKRGGLRLLPPFGYAGSKRDTNGYRGRLESLFSVTNYISYIRQEYVALADGDVVVNLPLEDVFRTHVNSGADITVVCTPCQNQDADEQGFLKLAANGHVEDVMIGRSEKGLFAELGVTIMKKELLEQILSHSAAHNLYDFSRDVLQAMHSKLNIMGYIYEGYNTRIQSISDYFIQSMRLLESEVRADLFARGRPIKTKVRDETSTYYGPDSKVHSCVVADGCYLEGKIENSIVFRGVKVEKDAVVNNCILMQDTEVRMGSGITHVITDKEVVINPRRTLVGHESYPIAISKGSIV